MRVYYTREEGTQYKEEDILYKGGGYTIQGRRVYYTRDEGTMRTKNFKFSRPLQRPSEKGGGVREGERGGVSL